jgi:predicted nucleic acid-binding protein
MSVEFFLDTNVIVYSFDATTPAKADKARMLIKKALREGVGTISWQVIQEFSNLALRKFAMPMTARECELYLKKTLFPLCSIWPSESLYSDAIHIVEETGYTYYDGLILAAALESGASKLLTEDLQDGRKVGALKIENPFA